MHTKLAICQSPKHGSLLGIANQDLNNARRGTILSVICPSSASRNCTSDTDPDKIMQQSHIFSERTVLWYVNQEVRSVEANSIKRENLKRISQIWLISSVVSQQCEN